MSDPLDLTVSPSDSGASLALVAPTASEKERRRQETMAFYGATTMEEFAGRFGMTGCDPVKTLKRWVEKGRGVTPADLPPFQRPHELAAWWRRMQLAGIIGKKAPEWMLLLEQASPASETAPHGASVAVAGSSPSSPASAAPDTPAGPADHTPDFDLPSLGGDASDGERMLLAAAQGWLDEMRAGQKARDMKRFSRAWNEYKALIKELRAWQKDRQRERLASGELMEAEAEKAALGVIFAAMGKTFTASLDLVVAKLQPDLDASKRRQLVIPYRDKIFSALKGTRFQTLVPVEQLETFLAA